VIVLGGFAGCAQQVLAGLAVTDSAACLPSSADANLFEFAQDAISRVSMNNLAGMMDEVLIALARCKQPTCKVPSAACSAAIWSKIYLPLQPFRQQSSARAPSSADCLILQLVTGLTIRQVLLSMARRSWRQQTIDQLLFAPEEVPQEALERLHRWRAWHHMHWSVRAVSDQAVMHRETGQRNQQIQTGEPHTNLSFTQQDALVSRHHSKG
jgi:hypothetical protein